MDRSDRRSDPDVESIPRRARCDRPSRTSERGSASVAVPTIGSGAGPRLRRALGLAALDRWTANGPATRRRNVGEGNWPRAIAASLADESGRRNRRIGCRDVRARRALATVASAVERPERDRERRLGTGGPSLSSGRPDLNRGPHRPERCALPGCATPREERIVAEGGGRAVLAGASEAADARPLLCGSGGFKA